MTAAQASGKSNVIEAFGVDTIPDSERIGRPRDVVGVLVGSNMSFGTILFGWLPVAFGLDFWASVTAMAVGTFIGILLVAPLSVISMHTRTNLSTSSGATFGVRGRLIGSGIGLLLALGYTALIVWTGGGLVVGLLDRFMGVPDTGWTYAIVYAAMAAMTIVIAIVGYRFVVKLNRWVVIGTLALMALGVIAYAGTFTTEAIVSEYAAGGFWQTWALAVVAVGVSGPVAYMTVLGDFTRYISPRLVSPNKVLRATGLGLFFGLFIPQLFGTFTALAARASEDYVTSLVNTAPIWFLIPLAFSGLFGTLGNSSMLVYDMGLDLDAIVPRLRRTTATAAVAAVAVVLVFMGHFVWNAEDAITAFVLMLTVLGTPWAVITLIGHADRKGRYDVDALQVYNRRARGGIYWYRGGWSMQAAFAWIIGAGVGLLGVDTVLYRGPLLDLTGGVDGSFLIAGALSGAAYLAMTRRSSPGGGLNAGSSSSADDAPVRVEPFHPHRQQ
ncbi:purine-cytosine permease family protein [Agromyces neolithicus]|uniref:Cytosine permease n=1 Tax=Agromyces neolithicus TaxID=269420 RepID=A0ABN2M4N9_9MICO